MTKEIKTTYTGAIKVNSETSECKDNDLINHPPHYNSSNAECPNCERRIECIDIAKHLNFNIGNAIKYLWRFEHKNGIEDLKKAIWYINNEIEK